MNGLSVPRELHGEVPLVFHPSSSRPRPQGIFAPGLGL